MGMPIVLDLRDELDAVVVESMWNVLRQADVIFSTYKDDSEISRLNRGELALEEAHPDVREVSAIGVPDPDWGEIVVACVVLEQGAAPDNARLDAHCLASIARFKRPKRYVYLNALPKNNYGKVLKTELRLMMAKP